MMRFAHIIIFLITGFYLLPVQGQNGGQSVYNLLNLASNARYAALGGSSLAAPDIDPSAAFQNPALTNPGMHNQLSLNYSNYLADINYGYLAYGHDFGKWGSWATGLQYLNYGSFIEANEYGDILGSFSAAEYTFTLSGSYAIDSLFRVGINLRPIYSVLERYQSFGISSDAGLFYQSRNERTSATLLIRNFGIQLSTYATPDREPLPFEAMAAFTHKIQHAPFRLHFAVRNLQQFYLREENEYADPDRVFTSALWESTREQAIAAIDHLVAGVEFVPGNRISVRFSYNFLRRFELRPDLLSSASGLSFGTGLNLGWLKLDYALVNYHFSSRSHLLSACIDLGHFQKK